MADRAPAFSTDATALDHALLAGEVEGVISTFHENERPLRGLAGLLDWRFHGLISRHLRFGAASGRAGECVYLPVDQRGRTIHLILIGAGASPQPAERAPLSRETLTRLRQNLASLKLGRLAVSRSDFGGVSEEALLGTGEAGAANATSMRGVSLWIAP